MSLQSLLLGPSSETRIVMDKIGQFSSFSDSWEKGIDYSQTCRTNEKSEQKNHASKSENHNLGGDFFAKGPFRMSTLFFHCL